MSSEKEPVKKLAIETGNMRFTLHGEVEIRTIITRTVGRGKDPDKLVTHKQKWRMVTKSVSDHPRGKTRSIANEIFAMIREDYDNFDLPEPLLPPIILNDVAPEPTNIDLYDKIKNDENSQCPVIECDEFDDCEINSTKEKGSPCTPSQEKNDTEPKSTIWITDEAKQFQESKERKKEPEPVQEIQEDSGHTIEVQEGIPLLFEKGVHGLINQGIPKRSMDKLPEPKIKIKPKVNDLNNLLSRVRKVRKELDGGIKFDF